MKFSLLLATSLKSLLAIQNAAVSYRLNNHVIIEWVLMFSKKIDKHQNMLNKPNDGFDLLLLPWSAKAFVPCM